MENDQPGNFICRFCKGSFTQAHHLHRHVQLIHAATPSSKSSRTCPICGTVFANYEGYRTHLRHIHGQRNEGQIFAFKCFNDFFLWKTELERRSSFKYSLQAAPKVLPSNEKIHVYQCDAVKKKKISCSSLDSCAAMICATESMKNHEVKVEYWNTHVGHTAPVEEDELNAAINSVQSNEDSTMHVMDMLNSIDQSIETGAEVFVTETIIEEDPPLSPMPKKNQKNIFNINIKKQKSSVIASIKNPPIVQNFSFKKDPSKKKESSIYSLASVACGKISANKTLKSTEKNICKIKIFPSSVKNNVLKSGESNSVSELKDMVKNISELTDEDSFSHLDDDPKSSLNDTSNDKQLTSLSQKQIVYNWPVGKPLPTDWVFSDPSEEKSTTNLKEKENISSVSNKIIVPLGLEIKNKEKPIKTYSRTSKGSLSASKTHLKQTSNTSASAVVTTNATQFAKPSVPLNTTPSTISPQIINSTQNFAPAQFVSSVLPGTQTYLSVNDKLIPYSSLLTPNLNSNVLLPIIQAPPTGNLLQTSNSKNSSSKGIGTSSQPGGAKQNTTVPLAGTIPTLPNTFSGQHLILLPCTNNSGISSILQQGSSSAIAPSLVLQSMSPSTSAPGQKMFLATSLLKPVTTAQTPLTDQSTSAVSTNLSKGVKVQKVSLPTASTTSATSPEKRDINSILNFSQPSQVSSVILNATPISSTPTINIPGTSKSNVQKPGTFVFESSGELYMLEPLDDDLVTKVSDTPLTSTPKKLSDSSKAESLKRKHSAKKTNNENVLQKSNKLKKLETSQKLPTTMGEVTKNLHFSENKNFSEELESPFTDFRRSILKTKDSDKTSSTDIRTKLPDNPLKYASSQLTVKTVPSFSLHQTRPVTSSLNSLKTLTSSSFTTSSTYNYISSTSQSTASANKSTLLSSEKETRTSNKIEDPLHQEICPSNQNVEVKRNVTIKSVVQEKRSTDDDLEVMKKVKFYKLEMKYLACQEQCKKLKIELAKALSKNKELLQSIEYKVNNEMQQNNSNTKTEHMSEKEEDTPTVENEKPTLNEDRDSAGIEQEELTNSETPNEKEETNCDVKSTFSLDNVDSDRSDSRNDMDIEFDAESNGLNNEQIESDQVLKDEEDMLNDEEKGTTEHTTSVLEQEMDVDTKESTDEKQEVKKDTEAKTDSNIDVFTMVRASVLKNLYTNIDDLSEENQELTKKLEEYRKLNLKIVPSFEEYEDSL